METMNRPETCRTHSKIRLVLIVILVSVALLVTVGSAVGQSGALKVTSFPSGAKVTIDGAALFRHEELAAIEDPPEDPQERLAKEKGLTYVKLDGNVGILGNGAGLCMSTLDVVANAGGAPANFLDAGGGSKADAIVDALEVITSDPKVTAVLFNIFGGITRGDEVARGIIEAYERVDMDVPLVVRLDGTNSEEGLQLLAEANLDGLHNAKTMLGAAEQVVELAGK